MTPENLNKAPWVANVTTFSGIRDAYRIAMFALIALLFSGLAAPTLGAQEGPADTVTPTTGVETRIDDHTLIVTAGAAESLEITGNPGSGSGRTIRCGWFDFIIDGWLVIDVVQIANPEIGQSMLSWCWYADDGTTLAGSPRVVIYTGPTVPGRPTTTEETSQFAIANITFADPVIALNPVGDQVVGIASWLAVTSRLEYPEISAQTGPVWATVRPVFHHVAFDMGNGDIVECTLDGDATTVWDPDGAHNQTSGCTHLYESNGAGDGATTISATVTWTIEQQTNLNHAWHHWGSFSLTTTDEIIVRELQAVID